MKLTLNEVVQKYGISDKDLAGLMPRGLRAALKHERDRANLLEGELSAMRKAHHFRRAFGRDIEDAPRAVRKGFETDFPDGAPSPEQLREFAHDYGLRLKGEETDE